VIDFLVGKTGVIAAIAVVLALLVALNALLRPVLENARKRRTERGALVLTSPVLSELVSYSRSCELRFEVSNAGANPVVVTAVRLRVLRQGPSPSSRATKVAAPVTVHQHRVELKEGKDDYDIRARTYGPGLPPLSFSSGEVEAFLVKLVSKCPREYEFVVELDWYDAKKPTEPHTLSSGALVVDFPFTDEELPRR